MSESSPPLCAGREVPVPLLFNSIVLISMTVVTFAIATLVDYAIMKDRIINRYLFGKKSDTFTRTLSRFFILVSAWVIGFVVSVIPWYVLANGVLGVQPYAPVGCFGIDRAGEDFVRLVVITFVPWILASLYVFFKTQNYSTSIGLLFGYSKKI